MIPFRSRSCSDSLMGRGLLIVVAVALLVAVGAAPGAAAAFGSIDTAPSSDIEQPLVPLQVEDPEVDDENEEGDDDAEEDEAEEEDDEPATVEDAVDPSEISDDDDEEDESEGDTAAPSIEDTDRPDTEPETEPGTAPSETDDDATEGGDPVEVPEEEGDEDNGDDGEADDGDAEEADDGDVAAGEEPDEDEEDDDGGVVDGAVDAGSAAVDRGTDAVTPDWTPEDWMESLLGWTFEDIMDGIAGFIDLFSEFLVGVPAPGEPLDPLSWYFPEDDPVWEAVLDMYWTLVALSLPLLTISVMQAMALDDPKRREQMLKENIMTVGMYFVGPLVIGLLTHTGDVLATGIAPAGDEFLASPEELAQLGVGTILGFAIAIASPLILAVGVGIIVLITVVILISAAAWPLAWTARSSGFASFRSMGNLVATSFTLLLILRGIQSIGLRFLFEIPLEELSAGALAVFLVLNALGLYYLLYELPMGVLTKTFAASSVTLGMSYMPRQFSAVDAVKTGQRGYKQTRSAASSARSAVSRRLPNNVGRKGSSNSNSNSRSRSERSEGSSPSRDGGSPVVRTPVSSSGGGGSSSTHTSSSGSSSRTPTGSGVRAASASRPRSESDSGLRQVGKIGRLPGRDRYRHMKRSPTAAGKKGKSASTSGSD